VFFSHADLVVCKSWQELNVTAGSKMAFHISSEAFPFSALFVLLWKLTADN
jgi:hypothetical protein